MGQQQQIVAGQECLLGNAAVRKGGQCWVKVLAHSRNAQAIGDHQAGPAPVGERFQPEDGLHAFGVKADRRCELAEFALNAPVADVGRHEGIGYCIGVPVLARQSCKGCQFNTFQLFDRLVHRGDLFVGQAI